MQREYPIIVTILILISTDLASLHRLLNLRPVDNSSLPLHCYLSLLSRHFMSSTQQGTSDRFQSLSIAVACTYILFHIPDAFRMILILTEQHDDLRHWSGQTLVVVLYLSHCLHSGSNLFVSFVFCRKFKKFCKDYWRRLLENSSSGISPDIAMQPQPQYQRGRALPSESTTNETGT